MRVFLDAGVITRGVRSADKELSDLARALTFEPGLTPLSSPFLRAETIFHSRRERVTQEAAFLSAYFNRSESVEDLALILAGAERLIERELPLSLVDALHISAARLLHADFFVTTETGRKKPSGAALLGIRRPRVVTLRAAKSLLRPTTM